MTEDFLHYIWQQQLFFREDIRTADGEPVCVERPGIRNANAGADFTDARIKIGDTLWAGCVEIHIRSSDWEKHGHHTDAAFNNVILHVVYQHDADVYNISRMKIPEITLHFDKRYYENYLSLADSRETIACKDKTGMIDAFSRIKWIERLAIERLEHKSEAVRQIYRSTGNDWMETSYRQLARNFGFGLNALPFESLAKSLPLRLLLKHQDRLHQLEALLFGQAGMLNDEMPDNEYHTSLRKEYLFLRQKYGLSPVEPFLWKFLRLRPVNFPTIRIAQFAALIHRSEHLFSQIIRPKDLRTLEQMFKPEVSPFWENHYVFGKTSEKRKKSFGSAAFLSVMINTVAPLLFVYGKEHDEEKEYLRAVELLEQLPAEKNSILSQWASLGFDNPNAFTSQALLHLKNEYCNTRRCLHCTFGNAIVGKNLPAK
ncbi:MAG: DUF2851 family protein [Bacteroidales bacterium]|jgi:hypothetical protein|nr:DUF2851 family protein [Bacteroidales bacterium]